MRCPWEVATTIIVQCLEAEIIGETAYDYVITFPDEDGAPVEAKVHKYEFENFPHPVRVGTYFVLTAFVKGKTVRAEAWPIAKYWHPKLREE
jgi:hypothetical protein